jgi:hypothetical protein
MKGEVTSMRIDNQLPRTMSPSMAATHAQKEVPGEREPDGDADDRGKVATQYQPMNKIQSDTLGKKVNLLV